jgi:hypothetical protein
MNVASWLDGLAAAYRRQMTKLETFEYLQEIKTWNMSDDAWLSVKSLAKRRHEFPTVAELEVIGQEVRRQGFVGKPGEQPCWETVHPPDGLCYARRPR